MGLKFKKAQAPIVYILLQVPGFLFLGVIVLLAMEKEWISWQAAWMVMLVWVIKDAFFYRFYKKALSPSPQDVIARLHGSQAVVKVRLDPEGQVARRGEIWRAVSLDGDIFEPGTRVMVEGNRGLTLEVRRVSGRP